MAIDPDEVAAQAELEQLLGDQDEELEARFRELERGGSHGQASTSPADDPLADLKAEVAGERRRETARKPAQRFLVVLCPGCKAKNRVPLNRVPQDLPRCGRCSEDLVRERQP